ncbi:RNA helicase [Emmonsiellopsis sp. PD_5]|nr:RNA helicase [Emmonsiellopsis sp. PD_5]
MSPLSSVCLRCEMRAVTRGSRPAVSVPLQHVRYAGGLHAHRKPARMALTPNVARSPSASGKKTKRPAPTFKNTPFGGMNQTRARLLDTPRTRSAAELKRTGSNKEKTLAQKKEGSLFRALKMQVALAPVPYNRRNAIKEKIAEITAFEQFGMLPSVEQAVYENALAGLVDITPTPIQRAAIPALLKPSFTKPEKKKKKPEEEDVVHKFDQFLLAAETGSGKTLAYLLPILNWIKRAEIEQKETEAMEKEKQVVEDEEKKGKNVFELESPEMTTPEHTNVARPKAIILVPTSELVEQVGKLVKKLSHTIKFRSALISSSYSPRRITNSLFAPGGIDVLVSTPHLLTSIAKTNPYILSRVNHLIIDEADSLLDRSFSPLTSTIIEKTSPSLKQLILCSATIPRSLNSYMEKNFPDIKRLVTPNLHAIPRRVQLGVVDVDKDPYRGNKKLALADIIWSLGKAGNPSDLPGLPSREEAKHLMVFVNERETTEEVTNFLVEKGIDAVALSRDTPDKRQAEILAEFSVAKPAPTAEEVKQAHRLRKQFWSASAVPFAMDPETPNSQSHRLANTKVLVTTDLGSRGIDTVSVRTVLLYNVPHTTIDFIHRLGRTGRMGRRGRGIVLVGKKDRKDVVKEVREAMFRGQALI